MAMHLAALGAALLGVVASSASAFPVPAPTATPAQEKLNPAANRAVAERAATLLETRYVVPALGKRYAAALRDHAARGDYTSFTDPALLAERLTADLQAVAPDGHLHFWRVQPPAPPPPPAAAAPATAVPDPSGIGLPGIRDVKWLEPGVAYISFEHFDDRPEPLAAVAAFLRNYAGARALVIDSRGNHGGAFDMLGLLANHLFPASRLLANMDMASAVVAEFGSPFPVDGQVLRRVAGPDGLVRFQHWAVPVAGGSPWSSIPVYYLTSHETFSAAEHMAMILKTTGRAVLIGETTGGGNHFGGTEPVGEGLEMFVPVGHTTDPATGKDWEQVGIAPDVAVPADAALEEALRRIHAATAAR